MDKISRGDTPSRESRRERRVPGTTACRPQARNNVLGRIPRGHGAGNGYPSTRSLERNNCRGRSKAPRRPLAGFRAPLHGAKLPMFNERNPPVRGKQGDRGPNDRRSAKVRCHSKATRLRAFSGHQRWKAPHVAQKRGGMPSARSRERHGAHA